MQGKSVDSFDLEGSRSGKAAVLLTVLDRIAEVAVNACIMVGDRHEDIRGAGSGATHSVDEPIQIMTLIQ